MPPITGGRFNTDDATGGAVIWDCDTGVASWECDTGVATVLPDCGRPHRRTALRTTHDTGDSVGAPGPDPASDDGADVTDPVAFATCRGGDAGAGVAAVAVGEGVETAGAIVFSGLTTAAGVRSGDSRGGSSSPLGGLVARLARGPSLLAAAARGAVCPRVPRGRGVGSEPSGDRASADGDGVGSANATPTSPVVSVTAVKPSATASPLMHPIFFTCISGPPRKACSTEQ